MGGCHAESDLRTPCSSRTSCPTRVARGLRANGSACGGDHCLETKLGSKPVKLCSLWVLLSSSENEGVGTRDPRFCPACKDLSWAEQVMPGETLTGAPLNPQGAGAHTTMPLRNQRPRDGWASPRQGQTLSHGPLLSDTTPLPRVDQVLASAPRPKAPSGSLRQLLESMTTLWPCRHHAGCPEGHYRDSATGLGSRLWERGAGQALRLSQTQYMDRNGTMTPLC